MLGDEITAKEISKLFGVSVTTVYNWEYRGLIKPIRLSPTGRKFFNFDEVQELFYEGKRKDT